MKPAIISFLLSMLVSLAAAEERENAVTIAPRLGAGFGEIIEIEGKIVDDTDTRLRSHMGKRLIEVHFVDGQELKEPLVIELHVFSFKAIEIPDRGTPVRFRGYETGGFTGIPKEAFEDIPLVATTNHHFKSRFQVTKRLSPARTKQGKVLK